MKFFEERLEALDRYFAPKSQTERWIIILGVAFVIGYLAYLYIVPIAQEMYHTSEQKKEHIEKNIANYENYLRSISENGDQDYLVKKYTRMIIDKNKRITILNKKITFINSNLSKLSDLLFNQKTWSKFLDSISDKATLQQVRIDKIENKFVDSNGSFGHVLEVNIACRGEYKSLVKFMNELEQSVLVTDLYGTEMTLDKNSSLLKSDINLSVWGINH